MDLLTLDISVLFLDETSCAIVSGKGNFLLTKILLKEVNFTPEAAYINFISPYPYSFIKESLESCTTIALKSMWSSASKSPVNIIACGGDIGYMELGKFNAV